MFRKSYAKSISAKNLSAIAAQSGGGQPRRHTKSKRHLAARVALAAASLVPTMMGVIITASTANADATDSLDGWPRPYPGIFHEIRVRHSGMCLDVTDMSQAHAAPVIQGTCWHGTNQRWRVYYWDDEQTIVSLVAMHSGACLDVAYASKAHAAPVVQAKCWGGANQRWYLRETDSTYFELIAMHSGGCLDVAHASTAHAASVVQARCWGGENQQWRFIVSG